MDPPEEQDEITKWWAHMKIIQQKLDALTSRRTRTDQLMEEEPKEAPQTYATTPKKNKEQIQKKAPQPTMEHSAVEEKEGGNSPDSQQKHSMIMVPILLSIPKTFWATMRGQFLVENGNYQNCDNKGQWRSTQTNSWNS